MGYLLISISVFLYSCGAVHEGLTPMCNKLFVFCLPFVYMVKAVFTVSSI